MKRLATVFALLWACTASAQGPSLYDLPTTGDPLDLRENPRKTAKVITELPADGARVEGVVLSERGDWVRVPWREGNGWLPIARLTQVPGPGPGETRFHQPLTCGGAEPFWGLLTQGDGALRYTSLGGPDGTYRATARVTSANAGDTRQAVEGIGRAGTLTAILTTTQCNDGMSDRLHGLSIDVILRHSDGVTLLNGCCSLMPP